ncbi:hypothetical protein [Pedobacter psychrodurus]|uniref:hypothetical protein n=1 Tax=Pedobacter psychrodurus TaxID=2530456 RepID=UPI00292DFF5F|nr:hypothetical protein [Pedobacter psychrodurus]
MGFGFNLFFAFLLTPLSIILFVFYLVKGNKYAIRILAGLWIFTIGIVFLSYTIRFLTSKKKLKKHDFYGTYVIDRSYFKGRQADWQYNNFRFEIKPNDSIYFQITDGEKINKTLKGSIATIKPYNSESLMIEMKDQSHHILASDPTIYRSNWDFILIFHSEKFGNMYFKKANWSAIRN